ncbi:MAG: chromosome segregation protein SMC [Actinomycetota bacterium]|nr:chromosome segregation protein SMC [Actinomycetota bacterium]
MLSAIYIKGFKTFARPVRMPLEGGVTAVVGPNGSGKSNITDAVLFALGEQSPGLLRAGAMGDLIFSGSETLSSANAAEVTLVLDNESGHISLPYREVSISRRISRGGDTEYRINGATSRLADVRAVAGEAGLGRHSILRQGAVDAIVAGGASACRLALEEAAGLGVYRRRRLSASRRLEKSDVQLEKARQLEAELAEQLRKIEREAAAARQYRELESRYRKLSLAHLYRVATQELDDRRRELERAEERVSKLSEREASLREEETQVEPELRRVEGDIRRLEQYLERLEDLAEEVRAESLRADRTLLRLESSRGREGDRARLIPRLRTGLEQTSAALAELEREQTAADKEYEDRRRELGQLEKEVAQARASQAEAERARARLAGRLEQARARRDRNVARGTVLGEDELDKISEMVEELERLANPDQKPAGRSLQQMLGVHRQRISALDSQVQRRRGILDSVVGRAESRVRSLQIPDTNGSPVPRLDEVISARPGYEAAVEAAIGESGRGVLVQDLEEGVKLLSSTERIALRLDAEKVEERERPPGKPLLECVEVLDDRYTEPVKSLLGGIYVAESPENNAPGNGYVIVTRDGLRLTRTTVSRRPGEGRFTREARLANETERLAALKNGPGGMLYDLQDAVSAAADRLRELESGAESTMTLATRTARISALMVREAARRRDRAITSRQRHLEREQVAAALEEEVSATEKALEETRSSMADADLGLRDVSAELEARLQSLKEVESRRERLKAGIREGERRRAEISRQLDKLEGDSQTNAARAIQVSTRAADASGRLTARLRDRRARLRQHRAALTENQHRISEERASISHRAVDLARELANARAAATRLEEDLERAESSSQAAAEEISEEWGATLEMAREEAESLSEDTEKERNNLARKLKRFGDVNLLALSQEEGLRERHEFVAAQRADAEAAANEISRIIQEIDREIEARFTQTFGRVRKAFAEIMPRMMRGASGRLELSEEGVEVGLRLGRRGWKPLNVLSGGERSLLALSFLFSIFLSRPGDSAATFCMLDEAEAALDDVNLARFLAVVDSYRAGGQFMLVTHQKRTMAAADVLYGVAQDASGATAVVSKRLSGE